MVPISRTQTLVVLLLCLLLAAVLRFHALPDIPPGLHYDEAANAILAAEIGRGQSQPIFIESYTGKEVLFFYAAGGLMRLVGESLFTLRLTAAFTGLLLVATTYWLGRELGLSRQVALLAAALLAVSFWHLLFSRLGFRAITQPLLQALTVAALFRGVRRGQWRWLVVAGLFLGLTAYTYLAARLFPLLLLTALLPLLLSRAQWRLRWSQLAVTAVTALLILSPLLSYFVAQPAAFWVRIDQVGAGETGLTPLVGYLRALEMFFLRGDPYIRFNVPERPLFSLLWGALLVMGWVALLTAWKRLRCDWQRSATLLLLTAPFIMILPTALATQEILPSNLRAIGLLPFLFYLPAKGMGWLLAEMAERYQRPELMTRGFLTVTLIFLLVEGVFTAQTYFQEWGTDAALFYETDGDLTAVAPFLNEQSLIDQPVYVAAKYYQPPTIAFLSSAYDSLKWLPQSKALVLPAAGPALYIFTHNSPLPVWAEPFLATAERVYNSEAFVVYQLGAPPEMAPPNPQSIQFGNAVTLLGYEVETAAAGETMPVTLYWRIEEAPEGEYTPFVHLEDAWGHRWSQADGFAYPSGQWQPGEVVVQRVALPVATGAPPGSYHVRIGFFNPDTGKRLPVLDENGRYAGDSFLIKNAPVSVGKPPEPLPRPPVTVGKEVQPGLELLGYQMGQKELTTGEPVTVSLWWLATKQQAPLTTRLELYKRDNTGHILGVTQPNHGTYPFASWQTPQFLIDNISMPLPENLNDGEYHLQLRLFDSADEAIFKQDLGWITVTQMERLFTPPPFTNRLGGTFGNEITLLGYNLEPTIDGYLLDLIWQAQSTPAADYTVFAHVLHPDGTCCAWQQDVMPQQNSYPTSRWLPGEVVVDSYQIMLPDEAEPGEYGLEVGLYVAENGRRLPVQTVNGETADAVQLTPIVRP